ncbi:MAG: hypothetical protein A2902_04835 [Elusimicrobia bacterium RIFCSPLOWO2_01_FULL_64_13]|nr:MAG: hypothetical protein A2902_04835 [Elusimicrobia bacterium RIFCSPLOWO2_01_FULL_64_13]
MRLGLRQKYALTILGSLLLVIFALSGILVLEARRSARRLAESGAEVAGSNLLEAYKKRGEGLIKFLAQDLTNPLYHYDMQSILAVTSIVRGQEGILYVYVYDPEGRIVHDGTREISSLNRILDDEISRKAAGSRQMLVQTAANVLDVSAPIRLADQFLGGVRIGISLDSIHSDISKMSELLDDIRSRSVRKNAVIIAGFSLAILILAVPVTILIGRNLSNPIELLSRLARQIGAGDYQTRISLKRTDELGELAGAFNVMAQNLRETTVSKQYMDDILRAMTDVLIVTDARLTILSVNRATSELLGYPEEALAGQPFSRVLPGDARLTQEDLAAALRKAPILGLEMELQSRNGKRFPVLFSAQAMQTGDGGARNFVCVARDITERKNLEGMVLQSEKMSAVGQLAAGVAHEINNPLGAILGFAQGMARRTPPGDPNEFSVKSIEREAIRCKNLVQNLLAYSRASKEPPAPISLNQCVLRALSLVESQANLTGVTIVQDLAEDLPGILGVANHIEQVVVNLAGNSLDAMPGGGALKVSTLLESPEGNGQVRLDVEDTGSGIPPDILNRVFEPFFTTKDPGKGTGLGLAMIYEIVQKHQGTIDVRSDPGKSTVFTLRFPALPPS